MPAAVDTKKKHSERRQRAAQANARLSPQELDHLRQAATRENKSVSQYLRDLIVEHTQPAT